MTAPSPALTKEALLPKAESGDAAAQFQLGNLYDAPDNSSSPDDCRQALIWYEKAAAQHFPKAAEYAGYMILNGLAGRLEVPDEGKTSTKIDHARAIKWLVPAAEGGSEWAAQMIATSYFRGQGVPEDAAKAFPWFQRGAELGSPDCMFRVGYFYANGIGVARDEAKGVEWFRKAADGGSSPGRACLGAMAWGGRGMQQDFAVARHWFEQAMASRGGNSWAPFMLGIMSENGQGSPRDLQQAVEYYKKAAAGGYYQAKIRCGLLRANGVDVPDYKDDIKWLVQGAEKGNPLEQYVLGLACLNGFKVPQSNIEALVWLGLAAEYKMDAAAEARDVLRKKLSEAELRTADTRIEELKAKYKVTGTRLF